MGCEVDENGVIHCTYVEPETDYDRWYREDWMSDAQYECAVMLANLFGGFHHIASKIKPCGRGIETNTRSSRFATYDFNALTRAVIMAHANLIRFEICSSGPGMVKLVLHKRESAGMQCQRHPDLNDLIQMAEAAKTSHSKKVD